MNPVHQIIDPAQADAALSMLSAAKRVLVPTHQNVDADGLATPLALMHALKPQGIEIVPIVTDGKIPKSLQFLPGIRSALRYGVDPLPEFDLLCMLDSWQRGDISANAQYGGDFEAALGAITARAIVMLATSAIE